MLSSLRIKNFRSLEDLNVSRLGNVNLIVGKNNSGKSTVLDALRVYADNASLDVLRQISIEHDEPWRLGTYRLPFMPFECLFHQRSFEDTNKVISIAQSLSDEDALIIKRTRLIEIQEPFTVMTEEGEKTRLRLRRVSFEDATNGSLLAPDTEIEGTMALSVTRGNLEVFYDLTEERLFPRTSSSNTYLPYSFIPTHLIQVDELSALNDRIVFTDFEDEVQKALKLIANEVEDVAFVELDERTPTKRSRKQAVVKVKGETKPIPLNSMGEGMSRVLQLILSILPAKDGILLIDEFENGLHFSIQEKIWGLIFDLSVRFNIQVFATTHSWDCIESFAKVAKERREEGVLFRLERSAMPEDEGKIVAIEYSEDELLTMTKANFEVR